MLTMLGAGTNWTHRHESTALGVCVLNTKVRRKGKAVVVMAALLSWVPRIIALGAWVLKRLSPSVLTRCPGLWKCHWGCKARWSFLLPAHTSLVRPHPPKSSPRALACLSPWQFWDYCPTVLYMEFYLLYIVRFLTPDVDISLEPERVVSLCTSCLSGGVPWALSPWGWTSLEHGLE